MSLGKRAGLKAEGAQGLGGDAPVGEESIPTALPAAQVRDLLLIQIHRSDTSVSYIGQLHRYKIVAW